MIEELDVVALKRDRADLGLKAGDEGAVVLVYGDEACEVEFVNPDGTTRVIVDIGGQTVSLPTTSLTMDGRFATSTLSRAQIRALADGPAR